MNTKTKATETTTTCKNIVQEIEEQLKAYNQSIADNNPIEIDLDQIASTLATESEQAKKDFITNFLNELAQDRAKAFNNYVEQPTCNKYVLAQDSEDNYIVKNVSVFVNLADIEKTYRYNEAVRKGNFDEAKGKYIIDKNITIFGAMRLYGLIDQYTRFLVMPSFNELLAKDKQIVEHKIDLSRIIIDGKTIFDEEEGKCFATNSKNNLEKQLNIIAKFLQLVDGEGKPLTFKKKHSVFLAMFAKKARITWNTENKQAKGTAKETKALQMLDAFCRLANIIKNGGDITVQTNK